MRVLVVEDEHRIANTLKKGLEQERYAVDVAYTGDDGLDFATSETYDVIILDMMLPGVDGLEICRTLRKQNIHTPILMLTAKGQIHEKVEGLDAGADDYLTKPFCFEELLARVRALGRRPAAATSTELRLDDLSLDPIKFTVDRAGTDIHLSSKEFALLEFLLKRPHQIVTKQQIIQQLWNYDADILPNTIEVYIRNLRNKIDHPFTGLQPLIQTVRGFGYKLGT